MSIDEVISQLQKKSKLSKEELRKKIDEVHVSYSGLITQEGAALILAKEMGVEIPTNRAKKLQIKNIIPGMRNVNFAGRIFRISPIRNFEKQDGKKGRVVNLFVADSTGYLRIPLWNDQVELVENESLKVGDVVQVVNASSRENIYGDVEIHVGKFGSIKPVEDGIDFISLEEINKKYFSAETPRVKIQDLVPGNFEIAAVITQVFKSNFVFESDSGEKFLVVSCLADDGSGDIRIVFFREIAEEVCNISTKYLEGISPEERYNKISDHLVGRMLVMSGRVQQNKIFENLELVVNSVKDINPLDESKRIVEGLESKLGENFG